MTNQAPTSAKATAGKASHQRFILLFILFSLIPYFVQSKEDDSKTLLNRANRAYQQGNYQEAITGYERLLADGYRSSALCYNLGNSYYRAGTLGRAILNFERAYLLAPGDRDVRHNLTLARNSLPEELAPLPVFFLTRWWAELRGWLSSDNWSILSLVLLWSGIGGLILWQLGKSRSQRKWGFIAGFSLLLFSVLPFTLGLSARAQWHESGRAVILAEQSTLQSAPDPQSKTVLNLPAGLVVEMQDRIRDWHQVRLPNGVEGWVKGRDMEEI